MAAGEPNTRRWTRRPGRSGGLAGYYVALCLLAFIAVAPLLVLASNSLKTRAELGRNPLGIPLSPQFHNFSSAWTRGDYGTSLRNSAFISALTVIGVCFIASLAAYALSRLDLPGASFVVGYLFVGITIPAQLYIIPLFALWV